MGLSIFIVGLFKKVVIADNLAEFVAPVFDSTNEMGLVEAWGGVLAYTFQIYFDFSGYSDMAIGLGRMFGIVLPLNFASPYKAVNIIEFWRRWHITLSRFLAEYLYIPLGGNRKGGRRRMVNIMVTMLLGGLWHGASWTFVIWGGFHGVLLACNHLLRKLFPERSDKIRRWNGCGWALTFICVAIGWVFFRAESLDRALDILLAMGGGDGLAVPLPLLDRLGPIGSWITTWDVKPNVLSPWHLMLNYLWVAGAMVVAFLAPNTGEIFSAFGDRSDDGLKARRINRHLRWHPSWRWALTSAVFGGFCLLSLSSPTEFLYFNF